MSQSINPWVYSLQFLFKSTNNSWRYERKCEWVFFSEHSVYPSVVSLVCRKLSRIVSFEFWVLHKAWSVASGSRPSRTNWIWMRVVTGWALMLWRWLGGILHTQGTDSQKHLQSWNDFNICEKFHRNVESWAYYTVSQKCTNFETM